MKEIKYDDLKDYEPDYENCDIIDVEYGNKISRIQFFNNPIRIIDKNVIIVEGTCCYYNEKENDYIPDWSLTAVFENVENESDFDYNNYLYVEQDPPYTALHNFFSMVGIKDGEQYKPKITA